MLWNSCIDLVLQVKEKKIKSKDSAKKHLRRCGVAPILGDPIVEKIFDNKDMDAEEMLSDMIPEIWKKHEHYQIDLEDFASLPMHMCMLGIEKALIPLAKRVFNRKGRLQNFMYKTLVLVLRTSQKKVQFQSTGLWRCHSVGKR